MNRTALLRRPLFAAVTCAIVAVALVLAGWNAISGQTLQCLAWCGVAVFSGVMLAIRERLPSFFGMALSVAAAVNTAGYTMHLWKAMTPFDETVHAWTTFAGMAAIGWTLFADGKRGLGNPAVFAIVVVLAVLLGIGWEVIEWMIGIIGDVRDTAVDLVMDTIGAIIAAALVCWARPDSSSGVQHLPSKRQDAALQEVRR